MRATSHLAAMCVGAAAWVLLSCGAPKTIPPGERRHIELFNGTDMTNWKVFPADAPAGTWTVRDGVLVCAGQPVGYLRTERKYTSFELELEWRFDPTKGAGNSGVLLRVQHPDKVWPQSIEAQLESGSAGDIWNIDEFPISTNRNRTNGRYTAKAKPSSEKPLGEWNQYSIRLVEENLQLTVNGVVQNTATRCEVIEGWIALQSEGAYIEFRNIRLRPLP
jgi:hypothetical protein